MTDEEETTAQLLRLAGAGADLSPDRTLRIREAVHREWQSNRRRRAIRRGVTMTTVVLAAAAMLVLAVRMNAPRVVLPPPSEQTVATGERVEGAPVLRREGDRRPESLRLSQATAIRTGDMIETDNSARASMRVTDGSSVRIDRGSRVRILSPTTIELIAGAAYIATSGQSRGFDVRTPFGMVRDVGTQFEVRLNETSLRVRVRSGLVEIQRREGVVPARAGSETTVTSKGVDTRSLSIYGPEWTWTAGLAPSFEIEGRSLQAFLDHVTREHGWTLRYGSPTLATAASRIVLHGSVEGLRAEEAVAVALATSGLQYRLRDGELLVSTPADAK